jgi:hypothetical protein
MLSFGEKSMRFSNDQYTLAEIRFPFVFETALSDHFAMTFRVSSQMAVLGNEGVLPPSPFTVLMGFPSSIHQDI